MPNCGIVDVGSNTIRLSIYHYENGQFKLLFSKKELAGLAGYVKKGVLSPQGIQEAERILSNFRLLAENLDIKEFHVFATASLRNISNPDEATDALQAAAGTPVAVLSGAEEAALSYRGACWGVPHEDGQGLLADIGGGSTELVVYGNGGIRSCVSLPIGSLSLFSQHVSGLFPTEEEVKAIRRQVREALDRAEAVPCAHLRGVGGTIRAAARLCGAQPGEVLPAKALRQLYQQLKKGDRDTLRHILQAAPERVHTLLPGLLILNAILKRYEVETVDVSGQGVREGYLLKYVMGEDDPCGQGE